MGFLTTAIGRGLAVAAGTALLGLVLVPAAAAAGPWLCPTGRGHLCAFVYDDGSGWQVLSSLNRRLLGKRVDLTPQLADSFLPTYRAVTGAACRGKVILVEYATELAAPEQARPRIDWVLYQVSFLGNVDPKVGFHSNVNTDQPC